MRMKFTAMAVFLAAAGLAFGGVVKNSKAEITFRGFGTFTTAISATVTGDRSLNETDATFKGKGLVGGLVAKAFLRSGRTGELIDLGVQTISQIDHKRKEYTVTSIEKWAETRKKVLAEGEGSDQPQEKPSESDIRIVHSKFKVDDTGEIKEINGFPCRKYTALWIVEWENVKSGVKGTDKMETLVWTTPVSETLAAAQDEEQAFFASYMKAMGFDMEMLQRDILGTEWMAILGALNPMGGGSKMDAKSDKVGQEMAKIKGYPIVIDGKYFPAPVPKAEETQAESGGLGGALGKMGKNLLKKKPSPEEENAPALAFYTEVTGIQVSAIDPSQLQVPTGYKKK